MKFASGVVFWSGMVLIGIFAVPTALLLGAISAVWKGTGFLLERLGSAKHRNTRNWD